VTAAAAAFEAGEYRWVAELLKHVVFAEPTHRAGRELLADAFEQMGYQAESGVWRNFYLSGATELRNGVQRLSAPNAASPDLVRAMPIDTFLDFLGVRLNGPKAVGKSAVINFHFTDTGEEAVAILSNAALSHVLGRQDPNADTTLTLSRATLNDVMLGATTFPDAIAAGAVGITGNPDKLRELMSLMDTFEFWFNIVEP
jgi:alkyl sulfatase BDS1-like metallo-beta-lactamase superfamily hydrolase